MKEASGELSMTAITVVAIAAIAGVFTTLIYPRIKNNIVAQTKCANKFNCTGSCGEDGKGIQTCQVFKDDQKTLEEIQCPCSN